MGERGFFSWRYYLSMTQRISPCRSEGRSVWPGVPKHTIGLKMEDALQALNSVTITSHGKRSQIGASMGIFTQLEVFLRGRIKWENKSINQFSLMHPYISHERKNKGLILWTRHLQMGSCPKDCPCQMGVCFGTTIFGKG